MPRLAAVPRACFAVWQDGLLGDPRPTEPIDAYRAADLLRPVIVRAGIKHVELAVMPAEGRCLDALTLPRELRVEDRRIAPLGPASAGEVGGERGRRHARHLDAHLRIAG